MNHPELLSIPIFMILDYYLTIWASIKREQGLQNYITIENYELNPVWKKAIKSRKLINLKHILATIITSLFLFYVFESEENDTRFNMIFFGAFIGAYGMIIGRHVSNLLTYYFVISNRDCIEGNICIDNKYSLFTSLFQYLTTTITLSLIAVFFQKPFILGCAIGSAVIIIAHVIWIFKNYKNRA